MKGLLLELKKARRTGLPLLLPGLGLLGAAYALLNFLLRREALLALSGDPTDTLLTQLYGMLLVLNLFGIVAAACLSFALEFKGGALRKLYLLPLRPSGPLLCKFLLLAASLFAALLLQALALAGIGLGALPPGSFRTGALVRFALYAYVSALPVLSFMLLTASRYENLWVPLGTGVAGFLSGMALVPYGSPALLLHPFVLMLRPAAALSAQPDGPSAALAAAECLLFLAAGLYLAEKRPCVL